LPALDPRAMGKPDGRAAERIDAPSDLDLGKAGVGSGDADVGGQQQRDAERHEPALDGCDHGLAPRTVGPPGIPTIRGAGALAGSQGGPDVDEVEAAGEVLAVGEENPGTQLLVGLEVGVGERELGQDLQGEGAALVRPVEPDQKSASVALDPLADALCERGVSAARGPLDRHPADRHDRRRRRAVARPANDQTARTRHQRAAGHRRRRTRRGRRGRETTADELAE
jgi:hypothetical protein